MKDSSIERFSDLDTAWSWVVMVAAFMAQFVIGGTNFTVGLVHVALLERYGASQVDTAWASALYTSISNFGGMGIVSFLFIFADRKQAKINIGRISISAFFWTNEEFLQPKPVVTNVTIISVT